jgi:hypothetical protein
MPHPSDRPVSQRTEFIRKIVGDYFARLGKTREESEQKAFHLKRDQGREPPLRSRRIS